VNFGDARADVPLEGRWEVVVSSDPAVDRWDGALGASEAVILQRSRPQCGGAS
jgi:hypothetical protein